MKVIYQSSDRCVFPTAEACLAHEAEGLLFEIYDMSGEVVTSTVDATLVHLRPGGGEAFLAACREDGDIMYRGIEKNNKGWYYWNEDDHEYQPVNMKLCHAVAKVNPSFEEN